MAYEDIAVPLVNTPASAGMFGDKVRSAILDLDQRVSVIESISANYALKPLQQSKASTTTPTADADLWVLVEANSKYFVEVFAIVSGITTADFRTNWAAPSGSSGNRTVFGPGSGSGDNANADGISVRDGTHPFGTSIDYSLVRNASGIASAIGIQEYGTITTGVSAGQITFQWSQVFSNVTGTIVHAESFIRATLVG